MYRAMLLGAILSGLSVSPAALASRHVEEFHAVFSGFNEVGGLGGWGDRSHSVRWPGHARVGGSTGPIRRCRSPSSIPA